MPSLSSFIFRGKHQAAFPFCPQNEGIVSSDFFPVWSKFSYGRGKICSISFYRDSRIRPLQHHCLINLIIPHLSLLFPWCQHPFQRQSHLPRSLSVPIQRWKRVFVVLTEVSPGIAPPVLPWSCDSGWWKLQTCWLQGVTFYWINFSHVIKSGATREIEVICVAPGLREQKTSKASDVIRRNKEMKSFNGNAPRGEGINKQLPGVIRGHLVLFLALNSLIPALSGLFVLHSTMYHRAGMLPEDPSSCSALGWRCCGKAEFSLNPILDSPWELSVSSQVL